MIEPPVVTEEELPSVRQLPRMLTPFAIPAYRRMALALTCGAFAYGDLDGRAGLGGHPARWRTGPALGGLDRRRGRRNPARAARRGGRRPDSAEADRDDGRDRRARQLRRGGHAFARRHHPAVAPGRGVVVHRDGDGVLLRRLLGLAAGDRPRVRPAGRQRLRGHGAAPGGPGDRAGRRWRRGRAVRPGAACVVAAVAAGPASSYSWAFRVRRCGATCRRRTRTRSGVRCRHPRGRGLHVQDAVAARDAAVRLADGPGHDGPVRGARPVRDQGPPGRRCRGPRDGAGGVRDRGCRRLARRWRRCGCRAATSPG